MKFHLVIVIVVCFGFLLFVELACTKARTSKTIHTGDPWNYSITKYDEFADSTITISTGHSRNSPRIWRRLSCARPSNRSSSRKQWIVFGANVFRRIALHDSCQTCYLAEPWHTTIESVGATERYTVVPKQETEKERKRWRRTVNFDNCSHSFFIDSTECERIAHSFY